MKNKNNQLSANEIALEKTNKMISENIKKINMKQSAVNYDPYTQWYLPGSFRENKDHNSLKKIDMNKNE